MCRQFLKQLLLLSMQLTLPVVLFSQTTFKGFVNTPEGFPIFGADLSINNSKETHKTDSSGYFQFIHDESTLQTLTFSHPDFNTCVLKYDTGKVFTITLTPLQIVKGAKVSTSSERQSS